MPWLTDSASEQSFMADFLLGGVVASVAKTAAAIERVKLLVQNQDEM
jgi:hypothetical protein